MARTMRALICLAVIVGLPACGNTAYQAASGEKSVPGGAPGARASGQSEPTGPPSSTRKTPEAEAAEFAGAAAQFEAARVRTRPTLLRQTRAAGAGMVSCVETLDGLTVERAFAVKVVSTLIVEARLLLDPYRTFSRDLRAVNASERALARAANDTLLVQASMAHLEQADSDLCALARAWEAAGWSPNYFQSLAPGMDSATVQRIQGDARAAAERLLQLGIPAVETDVFARSILPIFVS